MNQALRFIQLAVLAGSAVILISCESSPRMTGEILYLNASGGIYSSAGTTMTADTSSYWIGNGVSGKPKIRINIAEQKAYFYRGGKLVGVSIVSTGKEGYRTPRGSFSITQKSPDHRSNLYGQIIDAYGNVVVSDADSRKHRVPPGGRFVGASMPNFMRFNGGVGMHAGYVPGYPASHGCVRMPTHMAGHFYRNVSLGTPVVVE